MATKGYYRNPATRPCFELCGSCMRCDARFARTGTPCHSCSGRPDGEGVKDPHPDDFCQCKEGTLRWVTKRGQLIIRKFGSDPFATNVQTDTQSEDERAWNQFIAEKREEMNDPHWNPITTHISDAKLKYLEKKGWA